MTEITEWLKMYLLLQILKYRLTYSRQLLQAVLRDFLGL